MLEEFGIEDSGIIPVCVMATMSSGKSTFLNAVMGEEILPEKNEACTARVLAILNEPDAADTKAYILNRDGEKGAVSLGHPGTAAKINADEDVERVLIVKRIESVENTDKEVVFIDTPGVNNSGDIRHAQRTKKVLDRLEAGVIVYLLNAAQLATNDDELLLQMVIGHVKKNPDVKVIFVLNKIDLLDEEKESISGIMHAAKQYIADHGMEGMPVFPLSALSAKTFRMKLNGKDMTKAEQRHLEQAYREYGITGKSILEFAELYRSHQGSYMIGNETVSEFALQRAIENTGIVDIERRIEREIISAGRKKIQKRNDFGEYQDWEDRYAHKGKTGNFVNYRGKVMWICKQCGQVNGGNRECLNCSKPNVIWYKAGG